MERRFADAATLGYAALFISGWLVSMVNAGWFSTPINMAGLMMVFILGGVVLAIAGVFSYFNGDSLNTSLFLVFGALFFSLGLTSLNAPSAAGSGILSGYAGWMYILFAAFTFYLWIGSFGAGMVRTLYLMGLWVTMAVLAIANWAGSAGLAGIAGYIGLVTSLVAGVVSAEHIIDFSRVRNRTHEGGGAASHQFDK